MLRGYYSAASGMIAQQRKQDVLSNNMANVLTPGYKAEQTTLRSFPEMLMSRVENRTLPVSNGKTLPYRERIGSLNSGVYLQETIPSFQQGPLQNTDVYTDLALLNGNLPDESGALLYTVQGADGDVQYTRNGNFTVDGEGYLVTAHGHYVLDAGGNPIDTNNEEFTVNKSGELTINGNVIPIGVTYVDNANDLVKGNNDLFQYEGEGNPQDARQLDGVTFQIQQGMVEGSNVDPQQTMTDMMSTYRSFEMNQRVLKAYDESMKIAVTDIGRIR
ncbi:flagellar hook-basal body protein [Salirhabdus salicampi]|uniref:flagellar hook-basal body protein n=1 Tax=Salirhabdus salicampi TaxID=476102 RepID=UPI0020C3263D|nr:flagellar hook-basal body protein [Salirhabdus salicampi]